MVISGKTQLGVEGAGMPIHKSPYRYGNLFIDFEIDFPPEGSLTEEHAKKLRKILPLPKPTAVATKKELEEADLVYNLKPVERTARTHHRSGEAYDDDDEEEDEPGRQQTCHTQ
eukprot:GHVU01091803.1.p1 GENE.GHVU01091803.1~~GHVU01091803.1.p1  ORF type:complete len:114 (-),score=34.94 GHVU01091803.1:176-517(-)